MSVTTVLHVEANQKHGVNAHDEFLGTSQDDKPEFAPVNSLFLELDTGDIYWWNSQRWVKALSDDAGEIVEPSELPEIEEGDEGQVLMVEDGEWVKSAKTTMLFSLNGDEPLLYLNGETPLAIIFADEPLMYFGLETAREGYTEFNFPICVENLVSEEKENFTHLYNCCYFSEADIPYVVATFLGEDEEEFCIALVEEKYADKLVDIEELDPETAGGDN